MGLDLFFCQLYPWDLSHGYIFCLTLTLICVWNISYVATKLYVRAEAVVSLIPVLLNVEFPLQRQELDVLIALYAHDIQYFHSSVLNCYRSLMNCYMSPYREDYIFISRTIYEMPPISDSFESYSTRFVYMLPYTLFSTHC